MSAAPQLNDLGRVGIWAVALRIGDPAEVREAAAELEELGFGALWIPGIANPGTVAALEPLLDATDNVIAAAGVVNVWVEPAGDVATETSRLLKAHPGRVIVGLGISHAAVIGERYVRPLGTMRDYLDTLDAGSLQPSAETRVLAANGPKMLALARQRSLGSHTYLMPPEHTAIAREKLGADALLAPEQAVLLESDPARAREQAREFLSLYLQLPNYMNNLRNALGLDDDDFKDGGSNRLVDAAIAWGDEAAVRARIDAHHAAGANHVCIQAITNSPEQMPRDAWRRLADVVIA